MSETPPRSSSPSDAGACPLSTPHSPPRTPPLALRSSSIVGNVGEGKDATQFLIGDPGDSSKGSGVFAEASAVEIRDTRVADNTCIVNKCEGVGLYLMQVQHSSLVDTIVESNLAQIKCPCAKTQGQELQKGGAAPYSFIHGRQQPVRSKKKTIGMHL